MSLEKKRPVLVFGYGQKRDGSLSDQTADRCLKAIELYRRGMVSAIYLTVSAIKAGVSMASAMEGFLTEKIVFRVGIVICRTGENTAGELDVFLKMISPGEKFILVSTWYHLPRIVWLALWRGKVWPWHFSLGVAWRHASLKGDLLVEPLKMANAVLRPLKSSKVLSRSLDAPAC